MRANKQTHCVVADDPEKQKHAKTARTFGIASTETRPRVHETSFAPSNLRMWLWDFVTIFRICIEIWISTAWMQPKATLVNPENQYHN